MGGLVQGAAHILHKLVHLCVAKWCHLPESLFIIEVLKADSVATVIHQHIGGSGPVRDPPTLSFHIEKIGTVKD